MTSYNIYSKLYSNIIRFISSAGATLQLPIRLEALQVLSCLVAGYLPLIRCVH